MKIAVTALMGALCATAANAADVTFTDVSQAAHVDKSTESYGATVVDINKDGWPDIFVSNHRTHESLYINQHNGAFTDIADSVAYWHNHAGADTHGGSFADFDNDGDLDLLLTVGGDAAGPTQFLVNQNGQLVEQATQYNIALTNIGGRLPVWYDYNHDGLIDVYLFQYGGLGRLMTNMGDHFNDDTTALQVNCVRD